VCAPSLFFTTNLYSCSYYPRRPFSEAMSSVVCGVMLAGAIMTILTLSGKVGALIALAALLLAGVGAIASAKKE